MPVSGFVIVCDPADGSSVARAIAERPGWTVGTAPAPERLPVVLEVENDTRQREEVEWARSIPGVLTVELVYVHYGYAGGGADSSGDLADPPSAETEGAVR